jgi:hypothetical protein
MLSLIAQKLGIEVISRETLKKYSQDNGLDFNENKPWGAYFNLHEESACLVEINDKEYPAFNFKEKVIMVNSGHLLSLHTHTLHSEVLKALTDGVCLNLGPNIDKLEKIHLPKGAEIVIEKGFFHQLLNDSNHEIIVFEKQEGICAEEDIIRYNDPYKQ